MSALGCATRARCHARGIMSTTRYIGGKKREMSVRVEVPAQLHEHARTARRRQSSSSAFQRSTSGETVRTPQKTRVSASRGIFKNRSAQSHPTVPELRILMNLFCNFHASLILFFGCQTPRFEKASKTHVSCLVAPWHGAYTCV